MPVATLFRLATVDLDTYSKDSKAQSLYDNSQDNQDSRYVTYTAVGTGLYEPSRSVVVYKPSLRRVERC